MKIFGKERDSLVITKVRACRALFMDGPGTEEIHLTFMTEDKQILTLQMRPSLAHAIVSQVSASYEAVAPPITRSTSAAQWDGMMDR